MIPKVKIPENAKILRINSGITKERIMQKIVLKIINLE
jgi:hypothetical protein